MALGLLLDSAAKGTVILLFAALVVRLASRASASARHWVWFISLAGLLLLPVFRLALPAWRVLPQWADAIAADGSYGSAHSDLTTVQHEQPPVEPSVSAQSSANSPDLVQGQKRHMEGAGADVPQSAQAKNLSTVSGTSVPEKARPVDAARAVGHWPSARDWLLILWVGGICVATAPMFVGSAAFALRQRAARRIDDAKLLGLIQELSTHLSLDRRIRLLCAPGAMPMTWGAIRPRLLVPEEIASWSLARQRAVLLHELGHIKRRDCQSEWIARLACAFFWFHPLAWIALRNMLVNRELACDDLVLMSDASASSYAESLLAVSSTANQQRWAVSPAIPMARHSGLESRLRSILDERVNRAALGRLSIVASGAAALLAVALLSPLSAARVGSVAQESTGVTPTPRVASTHATVNVVDESGKPVEGAKIFLLDWFRAPASAADAPPQEHLLASTVSDKNGIGEIVFSPRDFVQLIALDDRFAPQHIPAPPLSTDHTYVLHLNRGQTVSGTVRLEDGQPVARAQIRAARKLAQRDLLSQFYPTATTDVQGRFEMNHVAAGGYDVMTSAEQNVYVEPTHAEVKSDASMSMDLIAHPGVAIKGKFLRSDGGSVSALPVELAFRTIKFIHSEARSAEDGSFVVYGIPPDSRGELAFHNIVGFSAQVEWAEKPRGVEAGLDAVQFQNIPAGVYRGMFVRLYKPAVFQGRLQDENGKPYVGANVMLMPGQRSKGVDAEGRFRIELPPGVDSTVRILNARTAEPPAHLSFHPSEGEVIERMITLHRKVDLSTHEMRGQVVGAQGKPVVGAAVQLGNSGLLTYDAITGGPAGTRPSWKDGILSPAMTKTDAGGRFHFERLLPGKSDVWADLGQQRWGYVKDVDSKANDVKIVLEDPPTRAQFDGIVQDPQGHPMAGVDVYLFNGDHYNSHQLARTQTDGTGGFVLSPNQIPADRFRHVRLLFRDSTGNMLWKTLPKIGASGIRLRFREEASIDGRLVNQRGEPLAGASVRLYTGHDLDLGDMYFFRDTAALGPSTMTDAEGRFQLNVPKGIEATIHAKHPEYQVAIGSRVLAAAWRTKLADLQAADGATIEGVVRLPDGTPAAGAMVWSTFLNGMESRTQASQNGTYRLTGLDDGSGYPIAATLGPEQLWQGSRPFPGALHPGERVGGWNIVLKKPNAVPMERNR
jgi:beta-lactamase regulating signal transducer with metallopeptidase domain